MYFVHTMTSDVLCVRHLDIGFSNCFFVSVKAKRAMQATKSPALYKINHNI